MFDRGYQHLGNKGTHGTRSPAVEGSDHPSSPTLNGKLRRLNNDDDNEILKYQISACSRK